jgi:hypothetical protein
MECGRLAALRSVEPGIALYGRESRLSVEPVVLAGCMRRKPPAQRRQGEQQQHRKQVSPNDTPFRFSHTQSSSSSSPTPGMLPELAANVKG